MPFVYKDYIDLILKACDEQRKAGLLSRLLTHPTTANLKQACLNVYLERINRGEIERNTLESFFGVPPAGRNLDYLIGQCELDRFRPLRNLISGEVKNPNLINVELLAWLIDFNPRPWGRAEKLLNINGGGDVSGQIKDDINSQTPPGSVSNYVKERKPTQSKDENFGTSIYLGVENGANIPTLRNDDDKDVPTRNQKMHLVSGKLRKVALVNLIAIILLGGIFLIRNGLGEGKSDPMNTSCMYWADDHYEQVPCNEEREGRLILPMNIEKMKNFKRILRPDTITELSIGKIYYIKRNNTIEYYTESGNHPVETTRSLKKLSQYMFDKYLSKKVMAIDDLISGEDPKFINNR